MSTITQLNNLTLVATNGTRDCADSDSVSTESIAIDEYLRDLKRQPIWLCFSGRRMPDGKINKLPLDAKTGRGGSTTNADAWSPFDVAHDACIVYNWRGVGMAMRSDEPLVVVDLDHCRNADTGEITLWAQRIVDELDSYTEISVSGTGLHIWVFAQVDFRKKKARIEGKGAVEVFSSDFYITVSENHLETTPKRVFWRQNVIDNLVARLTPQRRTERQIGGRDQGEGHETRTCAPADEEVLRRAQAIWGQRFIHLYNGRQGRLGADESANDFHLAIFLARLCNGDREQIIRLMTGSRLRRAKWDEVHSADGRTYLQITVDNANLEVEHSGEDQCFELTEVGNARRLIAEHGQNLRYVHHHRNWAQWNGKFWQQNRSEQVRALALEIAEVLMVEARNVVVEPNDEDAERRRGFFFSWARTSQTQRTIKAMCDLAKALPATWAEAAEFDRNPLLLNVYNGTIDLRTGELYPHRRSDFLSQMTSVAFDPQASCPRFEQFLQQIFGDEHLIGYVQRLVGYILTGSCEEEKAFIWFGDGANGKSTLLEVIQWLLGPYARRATIDTFTARESSAGRASPEIARLKGGRLVSSSESGDRQRFNESLIKSLTGRDRITARSLYQEPFEFDPTFKIVIATNHRPKIVGQDHGIKRRLVLVPFLVKIPESERDRHLRDRLFEEMEGILAWAVRGCLQWQREGLNEPNSVQSATEEFHIANDVLQTFIDDYCRVDENEWVMFARFRAAFLAWCQRNHEDENQWTDRRLAAALTEKGFRGGNGSRNKAIRHGLTLLPSDQTDPDVRSRNSPSGVNDRAPVNDQCHDSTNYSEIESPMENECGGTAANFAEFAAEPPPSLTVNPVACSSVVSSYAPELNGNAGVVDEDIFGDDDPTETNQRDEYRESRQYPWGNENGLNEGSDPGLLIEPVRPVPQLGYPDIN